MSQPAWTLTGSLKTPDGHPHAGVTVKVTPRGQIVNDPVGSDLRAASATAVIDADGTLPPMSIVAQDGVYFTVSVPVLGTVTIASPAAGATVTLDDVFTALAVSPPALDVVQPALDAIYARLDALGAGGGSVDVMRPKVGGHLAPRGSANGSTIGPFATGAVAFVPLVVGIGMTVDAMVIRAGTTEAVNVRALLYSSDSDGYPTTLVTSGTGACSSTYITLSFTPVALPPGLYWACLRTDAGSSVRFYSVAVIGPTVIDGTAVASLPIALQADPGTYAAPAATISAHSHAYQTPSPLVLLRRSA